MSALIRRCAASVLGLACAAAAACAARTPPSDPGADRAAVILAGFHHQTVRRGFDPPPSQVVCFSVYPDDSIDTIARGREVDPPAAVMRSVRAWYPQARPASECPPRDYSLPGPGERMNYDRPYYFMVGKVTMLGPDRAEIPVEYFFHGLNGSAFSCTAERTDGEWSIVTCGRGWVS